MGELSPHSHTSFLVAWHWGGQGGRLKRTRLIIWQIFWFYEKQIHRVPTITASLTLHFERERERWSKIGAITLVHLWAYKHLGKGSRACVEAGGEEEGLHISPPPEFRVLAQRVHAPPRCPSLSTRLGKEADYSKVCQAWPCHPSGNAKSITSRAAYW